MKESLDLEAEQDYISLGSSDVTSCQNNRNLKMVINRSFSQNAYFLAQYPNLCELIHTIETKISLEFDRR